MGYARSEAERVYAGHLFHLLSWVNLPNLLGADLHRFLSNSQHTSNDRVDVGYCDEEAIVTRSLTFASDRRLSRHLRRLDVLCLEWRRAHKTCREVLALRYPAQPPGWGSYDMPYGRSAKFPPVLYYSSSKLSWSVDDPSWMIFKTEWIVNVMEVTLYHAIL